MRAVWAVALAIVAFMTAGVASIPLPPWPELVGKEIVFIGTSRVRAAVPSQAPPAGVLGERARHVVLAIPLASENQETEILSEVSRHPVKTVFVEILPYLTTLALHRNTAVPNEREYRWTEGLVDPWYDTWNRWGELLRNKVRLVAGATPVPRNLLLQAEMGSLEQVYDGDQSNVSVLFPWEVRAPLEPEALDAALAEVRRQGIRVIFFAPPLSQAPADFMGPALADQLAEAETAFARRFGVEVWSPGYAWPNEYFMDRPHLNGRGRERFLDELRRRFGPAG